MLLCETGLMREPLLYASLFLEAHRREYYDRLQAVREHGNWESWVRFFLEGVIASAEQAILTARALLELVERNRNAMRGAPMNLAVLEALQQRPIATVNDLLKKLKSTYPTIAKALEQLHHHGADRTTAQQALRLCAVHRHPQRGC